MSLKYTYFHLNRVSLLSCQMSFQFHTLKDCFPSSECDTFEKTSVCILILDIFMNRFYFTLAIYFNRVEFNFEIEILFLAYNVQVYFTSIGPRIDI